MEDGGDYIGGGAAFFGVGGEGGAEERQEGDAEEIPPPQYSQRGWAAGLGQRHANGAGHRSALGDDDEEEEEADDQAAGLAGPIVALAPTEMRQALAAMALSAWNMPASKLKVMAVLVAMLACGAGITTVASLGLLVLLAAGGLMTGGVLIVVLAVCVLMALVVTGLPAGYLMYRQVRPHIHR